MSATGCPTAGARSPSMRRSAPRRCTRSWARPRAGALPARAAQALERAGGGAGPGRLGLLSVRDRGGMGGVRAACCRMGCNSPKERRSSSANRGAGSMGSSSMGSSSRGSSSRQQRQQGGHQQQGAGSSSSSRRRRRRSNPVERGQALEGPPKHRDAAGRDHRLPLDRRQQRSRGGHATVAPFRLQAKSCMKSSFFIESRAINFWWCAGALVTGRPIPGRGRNRFSCPWGIAMSSRDP